MVRIILHAATVYNTLNEIYIKRCVQLSIPKVTFDKKIVIFGFYEICNFCFICSKVGFYYKKSATQG